MEEISLSGLEEFNIRKQERLKHEENKALKSKANSLNKKIDTAIKDAEKSDKCILSQVRNMPDDTKERYEKKLWLWNGGKLRTTKEVNDYNNKLLLDYYYKSGQYEKDKHSYWWFMIIFPSIYITALIVLLFNYDSYAIWVIDLESILFITFPLVFLFELCMYRTMTLYRIERIQKHKVPASDPFYQEALLHLSEIPVVLSASAAISSRNIIKNTKQILNPDTWPGV